ncbi:peptidylprolyl isomerase [candidate division KSB1 bacterium]|nr:peptidylprolyl isomerase [bacterium]RKY78331.1 MAG: peptidylprolyl isomerase [candidate division KSB1 bacterium]RKY87202.1 MAG: peptidylprolyl isomerase [candidate division KSB1 bacterium]HDI52273.1 peptidylprolyl isomerase [Bacteroidota bacterium]
MAAAKRGDTVKVHYTGKLEDGTIFDSSADREPLQFTIGEELLIPGFEEAIIGMSPGETKTAVVSADQAYGPYREEMVLEVDRTQLPPELEPEIGQQLQMQQPDGQVVLIKIVDVSDSVVKLDANHPLAGKDLTFDIQLLEIL